MENLKVYTTDGAGNTFEMGEVTNINQADGEFTATAQVTLQNKTEAVLWLLRYQSSKRDGGKETEEAAEALRFFNEHLKRLEIALNETGEAVNFYWQTRTKVPDSEVQAVFMLPTVRAAIGFVFKPKNPVEAVKKSEAPLKMSNAMAELRNPETPKYKRSRITLTPSQAKFERAILRLIRDNSSLDRKSPDYLLGNGGEGTTKVEVWRSDTNQVTPTDVPHTRLLVSWSDLYSAYTGKPPHQISGKEQQTVKELLETMKRELGKTVWQKEVRVNGTTQIQRFAIEHPLIVQGSVSTLTPEEAEAVEAGGEVPESKERLLLLLHPAYTHEIAERSVNLPADFDSRLSKALGKGRKAKTSHENLIHHLNTIRCGGAKDARLDFDTLVKTCCLERLLKKQGNRTAAAEIVEGLELAKKIGLLKSYTQNPGAKGQAQYQVIFNQDFAK